MSRNGAVRVIGRDASKGATKACAVVVLGLLGLSGCAGLSFECPTGDVVAYEACRSRQQLEQTSWGTEFRWRDFEPSEPPFRPPTSPGALTEQPFELGVP